jgi:hypothetical protein
MNDLATKLSSPDDLSWVADRGAVVLVGLLGTGAIAETAPRALFIAIRTQEDILTITQSALNDLVHYRSAAHRNVNEPKVGGFGAEWR